MATLKYQRYNVIGRIVDSGKNVYFCFNDNAELKQIRLNRAQTAFLIGKGQITDMICQLNPKGGVQFEMVNGQVKLLPVLEDITKKEIPESEKYKIIAILKDGKRTIGYRVQKGRENPLNLQPIQIAELDSQGKLANAKLVNQNGQRILVGVGTNLRDLKVYQPGDLMAEQKSGKLQGGTNQLKELIGEFQTTREPQIYQQKVQLDGVQRTIYILNCEDKADYQYKEQFLQVIQNREFVCELYAIVVCAQRMVQEYGVYAGFAGEQFIDREKFNALCQDKNSLLVILTDGVIDGDKVIEHGLLNQNQLKTLFIYKTYDRRKPDICYYTTLDQWVPDAQFIKNGNAIDNYFKTLDKRALGNIVIAQQQKLLKMKDRLIKAMTNKQLGLGDTQQSINVSRNSRQRSDVIGNKLIGQLDREGEFIQRYLAKQTNTTCISSVQTPCKDQQYIEKVQKFNKDGRIKFKIRLTKGSDNPGIINIMIVQPAYRADENKKNFIVNVDIRSGLQDQILSSQLQRIISILNE